MTRNEMFIEGRSLWYEYIRVNGYSFYPNDAGIRKLAKLLDLKQSYIRKCINTFLQA